MKPTKYPGYSVTEDGKVWSETRTVTNCKGRTYEVKGRWLKLINRVGYYEVRLSVENVRHNVRVHRLVAEAYLPADDTRSQVNHKDGNGLNNHFSNLEWCTGQENTLHGRRVLKKCIGSKHGLAKLNDDDILEILHLRNSENLTLTEIGDMFGVSHAAIWNICNNKTWKHVA